MSYLNAYIYNLLHYAARKWHAHIHTQKSTCYNIYNYTCMCIQTQIIIYSHNAYRDSTWHIRTG